MPPRRLAELARYGMTASASLIRRHPEARRIATLLATVRHLEAKSVDDALEMLDLLMSAELVGRARTASDKDKARRHPRLARASARLAVAVEALFDSDGWGGKGEEPRVSQVWEAIEAVISRRRGPRRPVGHGDADLQSGGVGAGNRTPAPAEARAGCRQPAGGKQVRTAAGRCSCRACRWPTGRGALAAGLLPGRRTAGRVAFVIFADAFFRLGPTSSTSSSYTVRFSLSLVS